MQDKPHTSSVHPWVWHYLVQLKLPEKLGRCLLEYISVEYYIQKCIIYTIFLPKVLYLYESGCSIPSSGYTRNTGSVELGLWVDETQRGFINT